jgi:cis-3-alkyl-4-acyloxetan-2-one decarboxylase
MAVANSSNEEKWRCLYPFASRFLNLDGVQYHYLDEGAGPALLLVHGNPTWSFYWRDLILALRPKYRLIAPDHIGCGLSGKPDDYPYRLKQHVDNLARLIEHLDLNDVALVGHDWGGAIGLGAVLRFKERFSRLVLLNTAAFRSRRIPWRIRICRTPLLGPLVVRGLNGFVRAALQMAVCRHERMTREVRAGYLAPYDSWAHRVAIQRFVDDIPLSPRHPSYSTLLDIEHGLPRLAHLPTALIWGMRDWCFTPHFLDRFRQFLPNAEVHRLADAGHWVMEDAGEHVIPIVEEFITKSCQSC